MPIYIYLFYTARSCQILYVYTYILGQNSYTTIWPKQGQEIRYPKNGGVFNLTARVGLMVLIEPSIDCSGFVCLIFVLIRTELELELTPS